MIEPKTESLYRDVYLGKVNLSFIIKELDKVAEFLRNECHQWESNEKGWYETRRRFEIDEQTGKVVGVVGSGTVNEMTSKLYDCINKIKGD